MTAMINRPGTTCPWIPLLMLMAAGLRAAPVVAAPVVDTRSGMEGKVVCGYQGWFRAEGDGSGLGWIHYGVDGKFAPGRAGIDLWPEVADLPAQDRLPTGFRHADGRIAEVFSSVRPATVDIHFRWMREHGIDGVMVQRFATTTRDVRLIPSLDTVLANCRNAARTHQRGWALMYDLSGLKPGEADVVIADWRRLRAENRVDPGNNDPAYFHHRGKPLVALWGLGFNDRDPMLDDWEKLIGFFREDPVHGGCALLLGVPYHWRTLDKDCIPDRRVHALLAKADIISPWSVGRLATAEDAAARVDTVLRPDIRQASSLGADYMPVVFPGFSWHNLQKARGKPAPLDQIPRRGGAFFRAQGLAAKQAGARMLYVAMFDELDEGTAIFKTRADVPVGESPFVAEPGVPADHYLRLTGELGRLIRGEIPADSRAIGR